MRKKILLIGRRAAFEEIREILSQISLPSETVLGAADAKKAISSPGVSCAIVDDDLFLGPRDPKRFELLSILKASGKPYIALASRHDFRVIDEVYNMKAKACIMKPWNYREFILRVNACYFNKTGIACIGGGTGLFNLLLGIKKIQGVLISSIVAMSDDGGSSGRLRASFGILPPGDVRRNLVALSNAPALMNEVLQYRFKSQSDALAGHNFGNLFLAALAGVKGSMKEGIKCLGDILNVQGVVIPATNTDVTLKAIFENGVVIAGESRIDVAEGRHPDLKIKNLWHEPNAECNIDAYADILCADAVIIGPGDLFTSIITNLIIDRMPDAIARSAAKKIYICNIMTKPGETAHYGAFEHIREIVGYLGGDHLDYVIISGTKVSGAVLRRYKAKGQHPVMPGDLKKIREITKAKIIVADVGDQADLVSHDCEKLKKVISKILGLTVS